MDKLKKRYGAESTEMGDDGVSLVGTRRPFALARETFMHFHRIRRDEFEKARKPFSRMGLLRWAIMDKGKFEGLVAGLASTTGL